MWTFVSLASKPLHVSNVAARWQQLDFDRILEPSHSVEVVAVSRCCLPHGVFRLQARNSHSMALLRQAFGPIAFEPGNTTVLEDMCTDIAL